jgi:hypothetical protein
LKSIFQTMQTESKQFRGIMCKPPSHA